MVIFFVEITFQSIAIDGYFMNLYFWLDLISTISLLTDIGWVWNRVVNQQDLVNIDGQSATSFLRASRGARIGARAGRVARVVRLVRLIRVVRIYKRANQKMN